MTVKLEKNAGFEFRLEPTFLDERKIQQELIELIGGYEKFAELEATLSAFYQKHLDYCRQTLGESFAEKQRRLFELELKGEITEELKQLRELFNVNKFYRTYLKLLEEKALAQSYAQIIVLCVKKPDNFNFRSQSEGRLLEIIAELNELKKKVKSEPSS